MTRIRQIAVELAEKICAGEDRVRLGEPNKFNGSQPGWGKFVLADMIEEALRKREAEVLVTFWNWHGVQVVEILK